MKAGVLEKTLLDAVRPEIEKIKPWKAVFSQDYVKRLQGPNVKSGKNKMELAEQVMDDIEQFRKTNNLSRMVMVWCGSTEVYMKPEAAHATIPAFEKALARERSRHRAQHGLRICRSLQTYSIRQRRSESHGRRSRPDPAGTGKRRADLRQRLQDRPDV